MAGWKIGYERTKKIESFREYGDQAFASYYMYEKKWVSICIKNSKALNSPRHDDQNQRGRLLVLGLLPLPSYPQYSLTITLYLDLDLTLTSPYFFLA